MRALVSLAHTVFNAGLGETWETNRAELRFFESADTWVQRLHEAGFDDRGHRLLQDNDPTQQRAVLLREARRGDAPPRRAATRPCRHEPGARDAAAAARPSIAGACRASLGRGAASAAEPPPVRRCAPSRSTAPEDRRTPDQTFLTFPEWYLVHSPAEYARYLSRGEPPSAFPLFAHIGQFWQGYAAVNREVSALSVQRRLSPDGDGDRHQHDGRVRA